MNPEKLVGVLSNVNRYFNNKSMKTKLDKIMAVSNMRGTKIYNALSYNQKTNINNLSKDLTSSKEYNLNAIISYSVLKYVFTGDIWLFDNSDFVKLKKELKKIYRQLDKKSYIKNINKIIDLIENKQIEPKELVNINDGKSLLFDFVFKGKIDIFSVSKMADWYDIVNTDEESVQHNRFRKGLNLLSLLSF